MSAKQSCDTISSTANNLSTLTNFFQSLNPFRSSNDVRNEVRNNLSVELTENDVIDIQNNCQNIADISQLNRLETDPNCINAATTLCNVGNDPIARGNCAKSIISVENVTQSNQTKLQQNCVIDSLINKISQKQADVNNIASMLALQNAKGPMTTNSVNNAICNNLNSSLSTSSFLNGFNTCINQATNNQTNLIKTCGARNISQSNFYNNINDCLAKSGVTTNSQMIGNIINNTSTDTNQTASFLPFDITYISIFCIVIVCLCIMSSLLVFLVPQFVNK